MSLDAGDEVVGMSVLRENGYVLTVSETGYGRLSEIDDYRLQSRGGKGIINYHTETYGKVAAIKVVDLDDDIIMISDDGVIIRITAESIRVCRRPSKGVTLMKIKDGGKVVTLARAPHEEETDEPQDGDAGTEEENADTSAEDKAEETADKADSDGEKLAE